MPYTPGQIEQMAQALDGWLERERTLTLTLFGYRWSDASAREMMEHGVSRRIATLKHCLERTFETLPPEAGQPSRGELLDATAFLQTFFINAFGATDNLAWVWVKETGVTDRRGRPLARSEVGLTPRHVALRESLSETTRAYLAAADEWFGYLQDYRHALAHRIPLYIPPTMVTPEEVEEFKRFESEMMAEGFDPERWQRVLAAQGALGRFEPVMMHSYGEGAQPMWFHGQMICDFATVIEIAEHVLGDLQAIPRAG